MFEFWKYWAKNRKGDLELDQLGKLILAAVGLLILIVIVTVVINGELENQGEKVGGAFGFFK